MARIKKYVYSPNTVVLDMKNQPDAEVMLKIAKSVKGVKVEFVKGGQFVTIRYPEEKQHVHFITKLKSSKSFWRTLETKFVQLYSGDHDELHDEDSASDTRFYHAMILK